MPYKYLKDRKEFSNKYYSEKRDDILKQKKEYRLRNIEKFKIKDKKYYMNNKEKRDEYKRQWRKNNRLRVRENVNRKRAICMKSWEGIIPLETQCQICGKKLYFNRIIKKPSDSIHFDHRLEGKEPIKCHPGSWLRMYKRTPEREKIWKECNFGMLCRTCNGFLFSKNRKDKLSKIVKYVYG